VPTIGNYPGGGAFPAEAVPETDEDIAFEAVIFD
jgi:hypothetical protein